MLDGAAIDAAEQAAAKAKYSGRLTVDFLEEKLGHRMFDRIRDLDVSGLKVGGEEGKHNGEGGCISCGVSTLVLGCCRLQPSCYGCVHSTMRSHAMVIQMERRGVQHVLSGLTHAYMHHHLHDTVCGRV